MKKLNMSGKKSKLEELRLNLFRTTVNIDYFKENYDLWRLDRPWSIKSWELDKEGTESAAFYSDLSSARIFNKPVYSIIHSILDGQTVAIVTTGKGASLRPERARSALITQLLRDRNIVKLPLDKEDGEIQGIITRSVFNRIGNTPADPEENISTVRSGDPSFINPVPYYGNNHHGYTIKHYVSREDSGICALEVLCSDYYKTDKGSSYTYEIAVKDGFWRIGRQTRNGDILFASKKFAGSKVMVPALQTTELDKEDRQSKSLFLAEIIDYLKTNPEIKQLLKIEPVICKDVISFEHGEREANVLAKQEFLNKYMGKGKYIEKVTIDNACGAPTEFVEKIIETLTTKQSNTAPVIAPNTIFTKIGEPDLPVLRLVEEEVSDNDEYLDDTEGRAVQHLQVKRSSLNPAVLRTILVELCYKDMARRNDFSLLGLDIPDGIRFTFLRGGGDAPTAIPRTGRLKKKLEDRMLKDYFNEFSTTEEIDKEKREKLERQCRNKDGPVGKERNLRKKLFHFTTFIWEDGKINNLMYGYIKKNLLPDYLGGQGTRHPFITDAPIAITYPKDYPKIGGKTYFVVRTRLVPIIDRDQERIISNTREAVHVESEELGEQILELYCEPEIKKIKGKIIPNNAYMSSEELECFCSELPEGVHSAKELKELIESKTFWEDILYGPEQELRIREVRKKMRTILNRAIREIVPEVQLLEDLNILTKSSYKGKEMSQKIYPGFTGSTIFTLEEGFGQSRTFWLSSIMRQCIGEKGKINYLPHAYTVMGEDYEESVPKEVTRMVLSMIDNRTLNPQSNLAHPIVTKIAQCMEVLYPDWSMGEALSEENETKDVDVIKKKAIII